MFRRILKFAGFSVIALVAMAIVLYAIGLRVLLTGGGSPYLSLAGSERSHLAMIARDREAQRGAAPARSACRAAIGECPCAERLGHFATARD